MNITGLTLNGPVSSPVWVVVTSRLSLVNLPKLLADFHRRHPAVEITRSQAKRSGAP